jgi:hypothetical protein
MRRFIVISMLLAVPFCFAQGEPGQALVDRALATELRAAQDTQHPMCYRTRKSSPRLTSTKEICETRDGAVARLVAVGDRPLSPDDEQKEAARLDALLADPGRQRHRKLSEVEDTQRALRVMRALPGAFLYQYVGSGTGGTGRVEKFTFRPNPHFSPPSLETQVLVAMSGQIWIDAAQGRVVHLEGSLERDVDFGWGLLGRLSKGGWIALDQADVGEHQWRVVRFKMSMSGRVLFRNKVFDTEEVQNHYAPVQTSLDYREAIRMLRSQPVAALNGR